MRLQRLIYLVVWICLFVPCARGGERFEGKFFSGSGDVEYLQLLDISRRMFDPDPEFQNITMLYNPVWDGFVEGPTWGAWWIQNTYGPTYCSLPFLREPYVTFLQNSQDLWFDQMGDGKTVRPWPGPDPDHKYQWVPPDGCLCDAAAPNWFVAKQGDGRIDIHDWGMEFTAAGVLMQAELLLVGRDRAAVEHYVPKLERCARFIESRRDPKNDLFLAGPAGNLLAPSYAGWKRPDGTYEKAYLTGLSVTHIAALDRLIELEKFLGRDEEAKTWRDRRDSARRGLNALATPDGYFLKSLDPDGIKHGVHGADKHGYFEASPNHDAICFRVVDDAQAEKIYAKIASIPGLRPHDLIIPNYPAYDDMYEEPNGIWAFGTWVNGGHWSTCEARMVMGYYRLGHYEDARRSFKQILTFARRWRMDNPLTKFGSDVYQPNEPINLCDDTFGPPAAMIRGLFEYLYSADGLKLIPHIPPGIHELEQRFPIRLGNKRIFLSTTGNGPIAAVWVNEQSWKQFDGTSVVLPEADLPNVAHVRIAFQLDPRSFQPTPSATTAPSTTTSFEEPIQQKRMKLERFVERMAKGGYASRVESAHAQLILDCMMAFAVRRKQLASSEIQSLPEPAKSAAEKAHLQTIDRLYEGLDKRMQAYKTNGDAVKHSIQQVWVESLSE